MKCEAIRHYSSEFSVKKMCKVLELDPSTYYRWIERIEKNRKKLEEEQKLIRQVERVFEDSDRTYGYRVIQHQLQTEGICISEYKTRKIMRENGLYPEVQRKYRPAGTGKSEGRISKNLLQQSFKVPKKNLVWAGDITYIKTTVGRKKCLPRGEKSPYRG